MVYQTPSLSAGCDTSSVWKCAYVRVCMSSSLCTHEHDKRITVGLNSLFSFSKTGCHSQGKEACLPYYLPIYLGKNRLIYALPQGDTQTTSTKFWICLIVHFPTTKTPYTRHFCMCYFCEQFTGNTLDIFKSCTKICIQNMSSLALGLSWEAKREV